MLNRVDIMGRMCANPELRVTPGGTSVTTFRIACDRDFKNKQTGEREADFINCIAWKETGEFVTRNFSKGSMIVVSGRLQIRSYVDKEGAKRYAAEVIASNVYFGGSKEKQETEFVELGDDEGDLPF